MNTECIGFLNNGKFGIYVFTDDDIGFPNVHIIDEETKGRQIHICVTLDDNINTFGIEIEDTEFRDRFIDFMLKDKCIISEFNNNYEFACVMWICNN